MIESFGMKRAPSFLLFFVAGILTDRLLIERPVRAQTQKSPGLAIADTTLAVGMPKDKALGLLAAYNVGPPGKSGRCLITTKIVSRGDVSNFSVLRTIKFNDGFVTEVSRNWGNGETSPEVDRLWRSFWGAVTNSVVPGIESYQPLSIRVYTRQSPENQVQGIDILVSPNHVVSIERVEILNPSTMLVSPPSSTIWSVSVDETVF